MLKKINFCAILLAFLILAPSAFAQAIINPQVNQTALTLNKGHLPGTSTNDNANAGEVGQVIGANVIAGSAVALTTSTTTNVTSISLTAGDWEVYGKVCFTPGASTSITIFNESISTTSAVNGSASNGSNNNGEFIQWSQPAAVPGANDFCMSTMHTRLSFNATTTTFLTATAAFTASTLSAYGNLVARRAR